MHFQVQARPADVSVPRALYILFLGALLLCIPSALWNSMERGKVSAALAGKNMNIIYKIQCV